MRNYIRGNSAKPAARELWMAGKIFIKKGVCGKVLLISMSIILFTTFLFSNVLAYDSGVICSVPNSPDSDGDGLCDYNEIYIYGTNPYIVSTDGDRYDDRQEIFGSSTTNGDMPHYVVVPGDSALIAACPEIRIGITGNIEIERVSTITIDTREIQEQSWSHSTSTTFGYSNEIGNGYSHTIQNWRDTGNESADGKAYGYSVGNSTSKQITLSRVDMEGQSSTDNVVVEDKVTTGAGVVCEAGSSISTEIGENGEKVKAKTGTGCSAEVHTEVSSTVTKTTGTSEE